MISILWNYEFLLISLFFFMLYNIPFFKFVPWTRFFKVLVTSPCNFIEITLRHGCSPVNLLHIFRTPFTKNSSERLLLNTLLFIGLLHSNNQQINIAQKKLRNFLINVCKSSETPDFSHLLKKSLTVNFLFFVQCKFKNYTFFL